MKGLDNFTKKRVADLEMLCAHAKRKTISVKDAECLLLRQKLVGPRAPGGKTVKDLARENLPRELADEIVKPVKAKEAAQKMVTLCEDM